MLLLQDNSIQLSQYCLSHFFHLPSWHLFSDYTYMYLFLSSYGSWRTRNVGEFENFSFQTWKAMEIKHLSCKFMGKWRSLYKINLAVAFSVNKNCTKGKLMGHNWIYVTFLVKKRLKLSHGKSWKVLENVLESLGILPKFKVTPYSFMTARALMMRAVVICTRLHKIVAFSWYFVTSV